MKNLFMVMTLLMFLCITCNKPEDKAPIRVVTELNVGDTRDIVLSNGESVNLTLLGISDVRDSLRNAIRDVKVHVSIYYHSGHDMGVLKVWMRSFRPRSGHFISGRYAGRLYKFPR